MMKKKNVGYRGRVFSSPTFSLPEYFVNQVSYLRLETLLLPLLPSNLHVSGHMKTDVGLLHLCSTFLLSDGMTKVKGKTLA